MAGENEGNENAVIEKEAKAMGWVPEESFRGNKEHWVDAEAFVEKGRHVIPIMVENNKRLHRELLTRDEKIGNLETSLNSATTAIEKLEQHYTLANQRSVANAKIQLRNELKEAREDNDIDAEITIQEKLAALNDVKPEEAKKEEKKEQPQDQALSPEFREWQIDNSWYGTDKKKTKAILRIAEDLRDEGNTETGTLFMDTCVAELERLSPTPRYEESPEHRTSKVEGGNSRSNTRTGTAFADLPKDAKDACWGDVEDLVGPEKRFKTQKEWETQYAKIYFAQ